MLLDDFPLRSTYATCSHGLEDPMEWQTKRHENKKSNAPSGCIRNTSTRNAETNDACSVRVLGLRRWNMYVERRVGYHFSLFLWFIFPYFLVFSSQGVGQEERKKERKTDRKKVRKKERRKERREKEQKERKKERKKERRKERKEERQTEGKKERKT